MENLFNFLHLYEFHVKVNFSFAVILRNAGGGHDPEFRYFYSSQNNDVVWHAAFRALTDVDVVKFKELFEQGSYLHLVNHKKSLHQNKFLSPLLMLHVTSSRFI